MDGIVDAHHHIWRQADLPWLQGPMQPRIFGPYEPLQRDYPVTEFLEDLAGTGVTRSVYVQTNWAPDRFAEEAAWVTDVAAEAGWPHAVVGYADFTADHVRPQLERLKGFALMRGLRQQLHWHENEPHRFAARADLPADPKVRRNVAALADYGWSFDLQVFAGQMEDAAGLAAACPDVAFVLQHAGMPEDTTAAGMSAWREGMKRLADCPNVNSKLSAFGTFIHRNDPAFIAEIVGETVAMFGAGRCLFGSNYPIEKLWTSYAEVVDAHVAATASMPDEDRRQIFSGTAERVYRL
jgi:predicted TIM-barrel fold metal-dependent hydrolase